MKLFNELAVRFHVWNQKRILEATAILAVDKEYLSLVMKVQTETLENASTREEFNVLTQTIDCLGQDRTIKLEN